MRGRYAELVEGSISNRGNIIEIDSLEKKIRNSESYISLYEFGEDILSYVKDNNGISGYDGLTSMTTLWIDFDSKDLEKAKKEVVEFIEYMYQFFDIDRNVWHIYFSGGKGFHIGLDAKVIGIDGLVDRHLPNMIKLFITALVKDMNSHCNDKYSFECIDLKIYNKTRIIRLPYSLHQKTKLYKIFIPIKELSEKSMDEIILESGDVKVYNRKKIRYEKSNILYDYFLETSASNSGGSVNVSCSNNGTSIFYIPDIGDRNNSLFKQACRLFSVNGLKNKEVVDIMRIIKEKTISDTESDIQELEFRTLMNSAHSRIRGNTSKKMNVNTMSSLTMKVFELVKKASHVPTGIIEFDGDMGGGLAQGNVYPIIGKGGTKKSLIAQEFCVYNATERDNLCIYFNMEMSTLEIYRRLYKRLFSRDFIDMIKFGALNEEDLESINMKIQDKLNNNLYIVDNYDLEIKDFVTVVRELEENSGKKVRLAVVDSMNMMRTLGNNEVFTAFENSKRLKELAKEANIAIMAVNHVTKGCPLHLRDTSLYVRGGEKILDNADAYFSVSLTIDKKSSNFDSLENDIIYHPNKVYLRLKNKRMTGNVINKILELEENLAFSPLDEDPKKYEING